MKLHLVDATFELFRAFYSRPPRRAPDGRPVNAVQGLIDSMLSLLREPDVTHIGAATDYVIESWRNDLFPGYKSSAGMDPDLLAQFRDAERALVRPRHARLGDGRGRGRRRHRRPLSSASAPTREIEQVIICSVDKDLGQLVDGTRDRAPRSDASRSPTTRPGIVGKFGVEPASHPGLPRARRRQQRRLPGLPGWGAKSAAAVLARWKHLDAIPPSALDWEVPLRNASGWPPRSSSSAPRRILYRRLATLNRDADIAVDRAAWTTSSGAACRARSVRCALRRARVRHGP